MSSKSYYSTTFQIQPSLNCRKLTCEACCTAKSENVASSAGWVRCRFSNLAQASVFWWNAAKRAQYCVTFSIMLSFQRHKPVCHGKAPPHDDQRQICSSDPLMEAELEPRTLKFTRGGRIYKFVVHWLMKAFSLMDKIKCLRRFWCNTLIQLND